MSRRGQLLAVGAVCLWALGRTLGVPELGMAALGAGLLVLLAVLFTQLASTTLVTQRRLLPPRLFSQQTGTVELVVTNAGRFATTMLQVDDDVPAGLADSTRFVLRSLAPGRRATLTYPVTGGVRGRHAIGPLRVRLRDPFGLASRTEQLGGTDELVVYPPVWELPGGVPLGGHQGTGSEGAARPLAQGDELANVRDYVRGDDLRKVHWRSTAHRGRLMVRQDESPQYPQATLVVDVRGQHHRGTGENSTFEVALSAAASAAYHLAQRRYGVRLLTRALEGRVLDLPWQEHLEALAVAEPRRDVDMSALWRQLAQGSGGDGGLLVVSCVPEPTELRELVRAGRAFTSRTALIVAPLVGTSRRGEAVREDVQRAEAALKAASWRVTVVRPGDRLDHCWQELLLQRPSAAHA